MQHSRFVIELLNRPSADVVGFKILRCRPISELPNVVFQIPRVHFRQHRLQNGFGWERRRFHFRPHFSEGFHKTVFFQRAAVLSAENRGFDDLRRIIVFFCAIKEQFDLFKSRFRQSLVFQCLNFFPFCWIISVVEVHWLSINAVDKHQRHDD